MFTLFRRFAVKPQGAAVIEVTMIVSLIAVAAIASLRSVSTKVSSVMASAGGLLN